MTQEQIRHNFLAHQCEQKVVLNHVLRDLVDILGVAQSNCVVVSEESGMQSMDPKNTICLSSSALLVVSRAGQSCSYSSSAHNCCIRAVRWASPPTAAQCSLLTMTTNTRLLASTPYVAL